jgi:hypothetical protein
VVSHLQLLKHSCYNHGVGKACHLADWLPSSIVPPSKSRCEKQRDFGFVFLCSCGNIFLNTRKAPRDEAYTNNSTSIRMHTLHLCALVLAVVHRCAGNQWPRSIDCAGGVFPRTQNETVGQARCGQAPGSDESQWGIAQRAGMERVVRTLRLALRIV